MVYDFVVLEVQKIFGNNGGVDGFHVEFDGVFSSDAESQFGVDSERVSVEDGKSRWFFVWFLWTFFLGFW